MIRDGEKQRREGNGVLSSTVVDVVDVSGGGASIRYFMQNGHAAYKKKIDKNTSCMSIIFNKQ